MKCILLVSFEDRGDQHRRGTTKGRTAIDPGHFSVRLLLFLWLASTHPPSPHSTQITRHPSKMDSRQQEALRLQRSAQNREKRRAHQGNRGDVRTVIACAPIPACLHVCTPLHPCGCHQAGSTHS